MSSPRLDIHPPTGSWAALMGLNPRTLNLLEISQETKRLVLETSLEETEATIVHSIPPLIPRQRFHTVSSLIRGPGTSWT